MIRYSRSDLARAFVQLHDKYPLPTLIQALARELVANHRTVDVNNVVAEIARHLLSMRHTLLAEVVLARPLTTDSTKRIKRLLTAATEASSIQLKVITDPALVGGCLIRIPGYELDLSITGLIKQITTV